jgi:putative glutamine amidotransferase
MMPNLATWIQEKDERWFDPFFLKHPDIHVCDARKSTVAMEQADGLLLTGGTDIASEFLRQEIVDPSVLDKEVDVTRDRWEFAAVQEALSRGLPILAICRGLQVFNVALGGTLKLDIPGHKSPEMKDRDIQALRNERRAKHRFSKVNSSHHQAVERVAGGLEIEAWCALDDIIEQMRLRDYPFALAVQYHPERGKVYDDLFEDFFSRLNDR